MGAISSLLLIGFTALAFAFLDYLRMRRKNLETPEKRTAIAQDLERRTLLVEIAIGLLAWIAAGFLKLRNIDISPPAWQTLITTTYVVLALLGGPGIYAYLTWKQSQFMRRHRLPDGTFSHKNTELMKRVDRFKILLLVFLTGSSLLLLFIR